MNEAQQGSRGYEFVAGLVTGACVGVGLAMWLAPKSVDELRARAISTARELGERAAEQLDHVGAVVAEARDEAIKRGRGVRDEVADVVVNGASAVVSGASEVSRVAAASKTDGHAPQRTT